ncbi:sulfite oxidase, mitochondrial-like isoform X1 [Chironomus tepperi]|uniref:sulfite oxidase, mitochondrial-like isoform X1 n=1 Tax=Chironomus tepperi TaxID=113505 RepID=UPI00391F58F0
MLRTLSRNLIRRGTSVNSRNGYTMTRQIHFISAKYAKSHQTAVLLASSAIGGYLLLQDFKDRVLCEEKVEIKLQQHEIIREDLPFYTDEELALHDNKYHIKKGPGVDTFDIIGNSWDIEREKGIWVSWGVGVYDITNLIDKHGTPETTILLAAGMALDPFWDDEEMAKIHGKPYIPGMMEKCRIGNIKKTEE